MKLAGSQSWTFGHGIAQLPHAAQGRALPTVIATWHLLAEWSQSRGMAERAGGVVYRHADTAGDQEPADTHYQSGLRDLIERARWRHGPPARSLLPALRSWATRQRCAAAG
jgi:hypothetical protein